MPDSPAAESFRWRASSTAAWAQRWSGLASGMRADHLKILLADVPALELLAFAATDLMRMCLQTSCRDSPWLASQRFVSQTAACVASQLATGDVFLRLVSEHGHTCSMRRLDCLKMHCKRKPARTHWQNSGTTQSVCRSLGAVFLTPCLAHPYSLLSTNRRTAVGLLRAALFWAAIRSLLVGQCRLPLRSPKGSRVVGPGRCAEACRRHLRLMPSNRVRMTK